MNEKKLGIIVICKKNLLKVSLLMEILRRGLKKFQKVKKLEKIMQKTFCC